METILVTGRGQEDSIMWRISGIIGIILAPSLSWFVNHSILWAIVHALCGWIYVIYWVIVYTEVYQWLQSLIAINPS